MNVKETLKRLHKKFPMMGLDELFELLDCYVEQSTLSNLSTFPTWEPTKVWYSTDKVTCSESDIYTTAINKSTDGKIN